MDAPDTVTDAVQLLQAEGYTSDLTIDDAEVQCHACGARHGAVQLLIRRTFRFEGPTDPADEAVVLGVECPVCGAKGIIVSAYGPDVDEGMLALLQRVREGT